MFRVCDALSGGGRGPMFWAGVLGFDSIRSSVCMGLDEVIRLNSSLENVIRFIAIFSNMFKLFINFFQNYYP